MKKTVRGICAFMVLQPLYLMAPPVLLFRLLPYKAPAAHEGIIKTLRKPGALAKIAGRGGMNRDSVAGLFASYGGYLTVSRPDGTVIFPLGHSKMAVHLVVTSKIVPVRMFGNTIDHLAFDPTVKSEMFYIDQLEDEDSEQPIWRFTQADMPRDNRIPADAVILFAKPKNVDVVLGDMPARAGQHFVLPDVFVKKGVNLVGRSLYVLSLAQFFKPVRLYTELEPTRYISQVEDDTL